MHGVRTTVQAARWTRPTALCMSLVALANCNGFNPFGTHESLQANVAPPPTDSAAAPPEAPPIALTGRWHLAAASGKSCYVTLAVKPGAAASGTTAPEGGCPGNFYTTRKWTYENGALILRDFKGQILGRLTYSGDRFEGQDNSGTAISLAK